MYIGDVEVNSVKKYP